MTAISQLISGRAQGAWSVGPDDSVHDAVEVLVEKDVGALLVMDGATLVGVVSERDCARKVILSDKSAQSTRVRDIMSSNVISASPDNSVDECMALMSSKRIRHLPILEEGRVVTVISQGDLVKSVISEQATIIDQLEHYITG